MDMNIDTYCVINLVGDDQARKAFDNFANHCTDRFLETGELIGSYHKERAKYKLRVEGKNLVFNSHQDYLYFLLRWS